MECRNYGAARTIVNPLNDMNGILNSGESLINLTQKFNSVYTTRQAFSIQKQRSSKRSNSSTISEWKIAPYLEWFLECNYNDTKSVEWKRSNLKYTRTTRGNIQYRMYNRYHLDSCYQAYQRTRKVLKKPRNRFKICRETPANIQFETK